MLDVGRLFKFKNMEIYVVDYLESYYDMSFDSEEEKEEYYDKHKKHVEIILMDLRRPIEFKGDEDPDFIEEMKGENHVMTLVLSNYELDDRIMEDIEWFQDRMFGRYCTFPFHFFTDYLQFEDIEKIVGPEPEYVEDHYKQSEMIYNYYKKIGEHYGVQFEPGEFNIEKLSHLSQD